MTECPSCALEFEGSPGVCPYCGYEFPGKAKGGTKLIVYLLVALMLWPLYELIVFLIK